MELQGFWIIFMTHDSVDLMVKVLDSRSMKKIYVNFLLPQEQHSKLNINADIQEPSQRIKQVTMVLIYNDWARFYSLNKRG